MNTPVGDQHSREYNEVIRVATVRWAILEQLKKPSAGMFHAPSCCIANFCLCVGFEDVIRTHFRLKRSLVWRQVRKWLSELEKHNSAQTAQLKGIMEDLKARVLSL